MNEEVLDLLDRCNLAAAWERDAAFVWASSWAWSWAALAASGYGAVVDDTPVWRDSVGPAGGMTRKQLSKTAT